MTSIQTAPGAKAMPAVDEEGFLLNPEMWSKDVAQTLAAGEVPAGLTEDHWKVIDFLRDYYLDCGSVPPVPMLRKRTGVNLQAIYRLFPSGLTKGACRVAGIPRATIRPSFLYP
ncbi:MAG: TusE/DsrC/DsvC family sulfur relay protein [Syntrophorhabdales bacterium]|jgi:TusE/DsrC/DsvC family sulfur relay protein